MDLDSDSESRRKKGLTRVNLLMPGFSKPSTPLQSPAQDHSASIREVTQTQEKRSASPSQTHRPVKRSKPAATANKDITITSPGPKDLALVRAFQAGDSVVDYAPIKRETPWNSFQKKYEIDLDGFVDIATETAFPHDSFIIKRFKGSQSDKKIRVLHRIRHENFLVMRDCFSFGGYRYATFEHLPISLAHVAKSLPYPNERELAAILAQILEGLAYLADEGLEHGSLRCSNILLSAKGEIKIAGQECCLDIDVKDRRSSLDVAALAPITMELMQKYVKGDGAVGVDDLERWPPDCNAVGFLSMTGTATSVNELLRHPLFDCHWQKEDIKWLVDLASLAAFRPFNYHE